MSMLLSDLVVEGIRRFSKSQKIPFKQGFNLIYGSNESGKSTILEVILELLFPDRFREEQASLFSWGEAQNSRAGLTLRRDKDTYRVLRDFRANKITLSKYDPEKQKYQPMAEEATEISSMLADIFDLPPFETYRNIFLNQPDRLPSTLPFEVAAPVEQPSQENSAPGPGFGPAPAAPFGQPQTGFGYQADMSYPGYGQPGMNMPPGMMPPGMMPPGMMPPGMMPPGMMPPGMSMPGMMNQPVLSEEELKEKKKRLDDLKKEYENAKSLEEIQFEIDGLQAKLFDIEGKKKNIGKIDETIKQAESILDNYSFFDNLPENIEERLGRYNNLLEMQAKEIEKINEKALHFDEELMMYQQKPPFYKEDLFKLGIGLSVAGIAGFFLPSILNMPQLKILGLLLLAGLGMMGYMFWQYLALQGKIEELQKTIKDYDNQRQAVFKKFEVEGAVIKRLMTQTDTESTDELTEKIEKYKKMQEKAKNLQKRKRETMIELDWDALQKEEAELKAKIGQLEEKVRSHVAVSMDPHEMKREIKEIEEILKQHSATSKPKGSAVPDLSAPGVPGAAPAAQSSGTDPGSTRMAGSVSQLIVSGATVPGSYERMLSGAVTLLGIQREKLIQHISSRLQLYLSAMTAKKYNKFDWSSEGSINLVTTEGGHQIDLRQLSPAARDSAFFALQFTLLELLLQKYPLAIMLDDPYTGLDEARQQVVSQALKRLSEKIQVILFSTQRIHSKNASHSLNLG